MKAKHLKPIHLAALGLLIAAACQQQTADTTAPPAATPPATAAPVTRTVGQQFSSLLSGHWVSASYLDDVARTRSPAQAFDHLLPAPASLFIAPFVAQLDSIEIGVSYGMHEGGSLTLLLHPDVRTNALPIRPDYGDAAGTFREISYRITARDTVLLMSSRNRRTHQLLHQTAYRRTGPASSGDALELAVYRGVNQLLLARQYRGTDSLGRPVQAQFRPDGTVRGLPFRKYFIQVDFTGPNPGDELVFDVYTRQQRELAASFGRDTLRLYTIESDFKVAPGTTDTTLAFVRGRLRYQLVRVR